MFCTILLPVFSSLLCIVRIFSLSSTCSCTPLILFCILCLFSHHYPVYPCVFSDNPLNSFVFCACFLTLTLCFPYVFSGQCSPNFTMFCTILAPISHSLAFYFPCVFSGQCSATFAMFCNILMPIFSLSYLSCVFSGQCSGILAIFCTLLKPIVSLSYHVFSLCFQWAVFRQLHYVLYRFGACFLIMAWVLADFLHEAATFYSEDYSVWFIFATNWSFMMLALSSLLQAIYAIYYLLHVEHGGESSNRNIRVFYLTRLPHRQGR